MDDLISKALNLYGPLGFGWLLAAILLMRNFKLQDQVTELVRTSTAAITEITALIRRGQG